MHPLMELNPFDYLPDNSVGRIMGILLIVLIGWQGRGFILAYRADKREAREDEVDLLNQIRAVTREEMADLRRELEKERRERRRLAKRVWQLESILHSNGIEPPPDGV